MPWGFGSQASALLPKCSWKVTLRDDTLQRQDAPGGCQRPPLAHELFCNRELQ